MSKKLNRGFETLSAPASLAATLRGFTFYLAVPISSIETLSPPASLAATLRGFAFYLAVPISSIEALSASGLVRRYPSRLYPVCHSSQQRRSRIGRKCDQA